MSQTEYMSDEAIEEFEGDPVAGQQLDLTNQLLVEARKTNAMLEQLLAVAAEMYTAPKVTVEEAYEVGTRIAAMDEKRFTSRRNRDNRPPPPPVPEWAVELGNMLDKIADEGDRSNAEIIDILNPMITALGHSELTTGYVYKMRNPSTQFFVYTNENWVAAMNPERKRMKDIIRSVRVLAG